MAKALPPGGDSKTLLPGYEMLGELGRGGMGVVYKARQVGLGRVVAVKMMLAGGFAGEAELARFRTEAKAVARLKHPGIVQIYETGIHHGLPYLCLEFVEGGSLAEKLQKGPLQPRTAARLMVLLAEAVEAAHQNCILHRDLKPANVFLMPTEQASGLVLDDGSSKGQRYLPKIGDFGMAKRLEGKGETVAPAAALTQTGAVMGTPAYMAPEQATGNNKEVTELADVYALGAILYELLTGQPPFRAQSPLDTLLLVIEKEPVPPSQVDLDDDIPPDLETICLKCLQKDPNKRYGSAKQLAADLKRFLKGKAIHGRRVGFFERTTRWLRQHPTLSTATAAAAVALFIGILIGMPIGAVLGSRNKNLATSKDNDSAALRSSPIPGSDQSQHKHSSSSAAINDQGHHHSDSRSAAETTSPSSSGVPSPSSVPPVLGSASASKVTGSGSDSVRATEKSFAGLWDTNYGRLVLSLQGDDVSGAFGDNTTLQGNVAKNKLTFTYSESGIVVDGWFELAPDGKSFTGKWRAKGQNEPVTWNGTRVTQAVEKPFDGLWESTYGQMVLTQKGEDVTGTYPGGRVQGKVKKNKLTFIYAEAEVVGEGWFELAPDGKSFTGKWREKGVEEWASWDGTRSE